jgi:UDP-glucuronate 4-epimerase
MLEKNTKLLITGSAGFIGFHLSKKLLDKNLRVFGVDNLNKYYSKSLKIDRLKILYNYKNFIFSKIDISNINSLKKVFRKYEPDYVIHLAAQAGVRYSFKKPLEYTKSNLVGFSNILECSRIFKIKHLLFSSSSSVYGNNKRLPLTEEQKLSTPLSFYAATKLSNELMAYSYSNIYKLPSTALRLFTVYGPWGRPDMSLFLFTDAIKKNKQIKLFNKGNMKRDFTYIDDVVRAIIKLIEKIPRKRKKHKLCSVPFRVLNIGNNSPVQLKKYLTYIEQSLKKPAKKVSFPMQKGEVKQTHASLKNLKKIIGFKPNTNIKVGIKKFIVWYNSYYK